MIKKRKCSLVLLCLTVCLIVSFCLIVYLSSFSSIDSNDAELEAKYSEYFPTTGNLSNIIYLEVYYEALCPDSQTFINNQLDKLLRNNINKHLFQKYVRVDLIPFGKANVNFG